MLNKSVKIATESIMEYDEKKGSYSVEAPIVDFSFVEHHDIDNFELPEDNPLKWIENVVREEFPERIYSSKEYDEIQDIFEDEDTFYDEEETDEEEIDAEELEEELAEYGYEILDRPLSSLYNLMMNWPDEAKNAVLYMLRDDNMSFKLTMAMTNISFSEHTEILKDWVTELLIEELAFNIGHGDEKGFKDEIFESIDDVIYYLRKEEDYQTAFYIAYTLLYLYRYIFTVVEHEEESVTNYLAEKIYRLWEIIDNILIEYVKKEDSYFKYAVGKLFDYLSFFRESEGLSIIDLSMYITLYMLSNKEDDSVLDYLHKKECNIVSARYKKLALYFYSKNNYKEVEIVHYYTNLDSTDRMLLAYYYEKYEKYEAAAEIYDDMLYHSNVRIVEDALDELVRVYEQLNKDKELLNIYYRQLANGKSSAFSDIYDFIVNHDVEDHDEEVRKLLANGQKYLDKKRYFDALIETRLFEQALDFIKEEDEEEVLIYIGGIIAYNLQYNSDDEELYDFLKEGLLELDINKNTANIKVLRQLLDKYL